MAEYSKMAHGSFISPGSGAYPIFLSFEPDFVQVWNLTAAATPSGTTSVQEMWNSFLLEGDGLVTAYNGGSTNSLITAGAGVPTGITSFRAALALQYQNPIQIATITKASAAVVTTGANHYYSTGDVVVLEGITGMQQISGMSFQITVTGATTFTIPWNTNQSNYTAISGSPVGAVVRKLSYPFLYSPGVSFISAITTGSTTTITTTEAHNFVVGQEVAFRIPPQWGTIQLNSQNNPKVPSSPVYGFVTTVSSATSFIVNIDSSYFTPFNSNVPTSSVPGLSFPQVLGVGDVNTGGVMYSGAAFYPSPVVNGFSTINGPAISGSFVNNTRNGFVIGTNLMTGSSGNSFYWQAYYHDYSNGVPTGAF